MRALLTRTRASAVRPANARQMLLSIFMILRTVLMSCSFAAATFSTPEAVTYTLHWLAPNVYVTGRGEGQINLPEFGRVPSVTTRQWLPCNA